MLVMILNIHLSAVGKFCYCYYDTSSFFRRTIMQNENRLGCSIIYMVLYASVSQKLLFQKLFMVL